MKPGRTHLGIRQQLILAAIVCVVVVHMVLRGNEPLGGALVRVTFGNSAAQLGLAAGWIVQGGS